MSLGRAPDPVPELRITDKIREVLKEVENLDVIKPDLKDKCEHVLNSEEANTVISVHLIKDVFRVLKSNGRKIYLHELIEGADFVPKPPELPPRNPELEARVQKLRIAEENKEYQRMTQNVDPMTGTKTFSFQSEVKSMNRQLTSVLNFLITVAAGFAFGYKIVEYTFGKVFPMQMLAGLTVATVIFFVDLYFMIKYTPV